MIKDIQTLITNYRPQLIEQPKRFAVLIPLIEIDDQLHLVYEVRAAHISQPGQTSFPGGGVEFGESFEQAALRETCEELHLMPDQIKLFGEMDMIVNERTYLRSFVGQLLVDSIDDIHPNEEVARLFTLPLAELMQHPPVYYSAQGTMQFEDPFPYESETYPLRQIQRSIPFYPLEDEELWGFTAQLTERFIELIKEANDDVKD